MITREEIGRMSHEEKRQTLEWIQESLDETEPAWVSELLAERRRALDAGEPELLTLEQVEERHKARAR